MGEFGSRFGITGRTVETEVFGDTRKESSKEHHGRETYLKFNVALNEVKKDQGGSDPTDPDKPFANDLHATIAEEFSPEDYESVRFYTAVGSVLDHFHGVDAFIEVDLEDGSTLTITLDVTTNPNKTDYKADVIIQVPSDGVDAQVDPEEYKEVLGNATKEVINEIKRQMTRKEVAYG